MSYLTNDSQCRTCHHRYGHHYRTYEDVPGCNQEVGRSVPLPCPCSGYMATESKSAIRRFHDELGRLALRNVDARLKADRRLTDAVLGERA